MLAEARELGGTAGDDGFVERVHLTFVSDTVVLGVQPRAAAELSRAEISRELQLEFADDDIQVEMLGNFRRTAQLRPFPLSRACCAKAN